MPRRHSNMSHQIPDPVVVSGGCRLRDHEDPALVGVDGHGGRHQRDQIDARRGGGLVHVSTMVADQVPVISLGFGPTLSSCCRRP